jgi:hypothetical protein
VRALFASTSICGVLNFEQKVLRAQGGHKLKKFNSLEILFDLDGSRTLTSVASKFFTGNLP